MKKIKSLIVILILLVFYLDSNAQENNEEKIMDLEQLEARAVLKSDTVRLFKKLWAPEFIVNGPANVVINRQEVAALFKAGKIDYESFDRTIEKISIIENTAIVMGSEEINPVGVSDHAGKRLIRRFTNIWMKRKGNWKLVGRQATISSIK